MRCPDLTRMVLVVLSLIYAGCQVGQQRGLADTRVRSRAKGTGVSQDGRATAPPVVAKTRGFIKAPGDQRGPSPTEPSGRTRAQNPDRTGLANYTSPFENLDKYGSTAARIVAIVNGRPILDQDVRAASYYALVRARTRAEQKEILDKTLQKLIDREIVLYDAFQRTSKGGSSKFLNQLKAGAREEFDKRWLRPRMRDSKMKTVGEFAVFLKDNGMSLASIRRHWESEFIFNQYMRSRISQYLAGIGHVEIEEYYDDHPEDFQVEDSVEWLDIFIATASHGHDRERARRFAQVLLTRIQRGEDFVKLAKEDFNDGDSAYRDGAGVGKKRGEISPVEVEPILFRLREGEVGPLVELPTGFHLVKVVKRQKKGKLPFSEKVQQDIQQKLRMQIFKREMKRIIRELRANAIIEIVQ